MRFLISKISKMNKPAKIMLHSGFIIVLICSIMLFVLINRATGFSEYNMLGKTIPSLVMSMLIVLGGSIALDTLLNENKDNRK